MSECVRVRTHVDPRAWSERKKERARSAVDPARNRRRSRVIYSFAAPLLRPRVPEWT